MMVTAFGRQSFLKAVRSAVAGVRTLNRGNAIRISGFLPINAFTAAAV